MRAASFCVCVGLAWAAGVARADQTATFDDYSLAPESAYYGQDRPNVSGAFTSGGLTFPNKYSVSPPYAWWSGFAVSNITDNHTAGYTNDKAAYPGAGHNSANYVIATSSPTIQLPGPGVVNGLYAANTTYAALSMLNGDYFSYKFGGADGTSPDWFKVIFTGKAADGATTGSVDYYLADYRFDNSAQDYISGGWGWVDLTSLGVVASIQIGFAGDPLHNNQYGLTIPAYVALDDISYTPEPATLVLLACAGLLRRR